MLFRCLLVSFLFFSLLVSRFDIASSLCCCFLQIRAALPTSKVFRFSKSTGKLTIPLPLVAGGVDGDAEEGEGGGGGGEPAGEDTEEEPTQATQA